MPARSIAPRTIAKAVTIAALSLSLASIAGELAWAKRQLPAGACVTTHRHLLMNAASCTANCNSAGWCAKVVCFNGSLATLPLPCHRPEFCPAKAC